MKKRIWYRDLLVMLAALCVAGVAVVWVQRITGRIDGVAMLIFMLAVFVTSMYTDGYLWGVLASLASVLAVNFAFFTPYFAFNFTLPENLFSGLVMLAVSIMTSTLTTRVKKQEQLRMETEREKMRANLLRAVSHDLRTPLTSIYGACSTVTENYDSLGKEQALKLLREACEDAQWLNRMVENLLSVTRFDGEQVAVKKTPTVLEELLDAVLVKFKKRCPDVPVQLELPEDFVMIPMDSMLIQQVLMNLLENAALHAEGMTKLVLKVFTVDDRAVFEVTDNGCGIEKDEIPLAFLRHSTSKIKSVEDLLCIHSLGFRGEALSSIAAVSQVELITKTYSDLTGTRYVIEGSREMSNDEIGAPDGTTFIVRNLFYNTPARKKFLKTAQTEGNYISDLMERLALSHPDVSFKFISNGQTKMHTSGNSNEKDLIYHIYGRDITAALLPVCAETEYFSVKGFVGKPMISRGNRSYESYFINGRYIKSVLLSKAVEEAYKGFMMQHQYPFCVLYFTMDTELLDVNVHPTKMELRFSHQEEIYRQMRDMISDALNHREQIVKVSLSSDRERKAEEKAARKEQIVVPEPFEQKRQ